MLQHQVVPVAQQRRAMLDRGHRPVALGAMRSLDHTAGFGRGGAGYVADHRAGGRVGHRQGLTAVGIHPDAIAIGLCFNQRRILEAYCHRVTFCSL